MAQVKKESVRGAIVDAAAALFAEQGFIGTTLAQIAAGAGVAVGNIYSYFPSKLHLLYEVYRPWLTEQIESLAAAAAREPDSRSKVRRILVGLWHDIPAHDPSLANSLMEALATADPDKGKPDNLLMWNEARLTEMFEDALPPERRELAADGRLANLCLMAFDGYVINMRLKDLRDIGALADMMCDMLLGSEAAGSQDIRDPVAQGSKSAKSA